MNSVSEIQVTQNRLASAMRANMALKGDDDDLEALMNEYRATVAALIQALGPSASCAEVDIAAWEAYVDHFEQATDVVPLRATRAIVLTFLTGEDDDLLV